MALTWSNGLTKLGSRICYVLETVLASGLVLGKLTITWATNLQIEWLKKEIKANT